jgi:hypothetical protein
LPLVIVKLPVPAVILNEIALASETSPGFIVLFELLLLVRIINGVPVTVMVVAPVNTVAVLFSEIVFVPKASVPVKPVQVRVWMVMLLSTVTTLVLEFASSTAASAEPGAVVITNPPEVVLQLVRLLQFPSPPTQYFVAIVTTPH